MSTSRPMVGRHADASRLRVALREGRHVLLHGPTGAGKTVLLRHVCAQLGLPVVSVTGTTTTTAAQLVGNHDPAEVLAGGYRVHTFRPGPLVDAMATGAVLSLDQANRMSPDAFNVMITAMQEATIAVPRYRTVRAMPGFRVVASCDPTDPIGTIAPPAAFLDRVVAVRLEHSSFDEELAIVRQQADVEDRLCQRAVRVVRASRRHPDIERGASVRGAADLVAVAGLLRRMHLGEDEAQRQAALLALSARLTLRPEVRRSVEDVIGELWDELLIAEHRAAPGAGAPLPTSSMTNRPETVPDGATELAEREPRMPASNRQGAAAFRETREATGIGGAQAPSAAIVAETELALRDFVRHTEGGEQAGTDRAPQAGEDEPADIDAVQRLAAKVVVRKLHGRALRETGMGRLDPVRFNFRSDDLDLDRTTEALVGNPVPQWTDIWVRDRVRRERGVVLMLDMSGSMRGQPIMQAAVAAATAGLVLSETDELALLAFARHTELLADHREPIAAQRLAERVLRIRPHGLTDISAGLRAGLNQLAAMHATRKLGVLLTDGIPNDGPDPVPTASGFARLNVLATTQSAEHQVRCKALAASGHGWYEACRSIEELPAALARLLAC